jgi:hypothetical protein
LLKRAVVVDGKRGFYISDRKIDHDRIRVLAASQLNTIAAAARAQHHGDDRQRNHPGRFSGNSLRGLSR